MTDARNKTFIIKSPEFAKSPSIESTDPVQQAAAAKFQIKSITPPFELPERRFGNPRVIEGLSAALDAKVNRAFRLYFSDTAFHQIEQHIGWGYRIAGNTVEQGGILLGEAHRDSTQNLVYAIVRNAVAGRKAKGSGAYLAMTHETWAEMLSEADHIMDTAAAGKLRVVGWYHTHPNALDVFMSGTDRGTQRNFFPHNWQFAVVLNPHKQIWRVYFGADSEQCAGFVLGSETADQARAAELIRPVRSMDMPVRASSADTTRPSTGRKLRDVHIRRISSSPAIAAALLVYSIVMTGAALWLWYRVNRVGRVTNVQPVHRISGEELPSAPSIGNQLEAEHLRTIFSDLSAARQAVGALNNDWWNDPEKIFTDFSNFETLNAEAKINADGNQISGSAEEGDLVHARLDGRVTSPRDLTLPKATRSATP